MIHQENNTRRWLADSFVGWQRNTNTRPAQRIPMKRLSIPILVCLVSVLGACDTPGATEAIEQPNIIFILADDLGYGEIGSYGQSIIKTPRLDQMAAEGMRFTRHYAGSTVCAPSRGVLMTGLHTGHTFVRANRPYQEGQYPMADSMVTVAETLQEAGYTTGLIGKWGLGAPGTESVPGTQGFDYFFGYNDQRRAHEYYPPFLWRNEERVPLEGNLDGAQGTYSHDLMTGEALAFIEQHKEDPFFLYLAYTIPHSKLQVPAEELGAYANLDNEKRQIAAGMISRLDRDVGKVLDLLEELGLAENTLVIFTSDNGPHRAGGHDPAYFNSAGGLRGIKRDLYEGGIRVPFIAWWPGTVQAGAETGHVSAFWDFFPTATDLAGVPTPANLDGLSYLPTLLGTGNQATHDYLYWEFYERGGKQAVLKGNWKAVRLGVQADPKAPLELYDLSVDEQESHNVADQHPEVVAGLDSLMEVSHVPSPIYQFDWEK